jgi:hypothetical protein
LLKLKLFVGMNMTFIPVSKCPHKYNQQLLLYLPHTPQAHAHPP